MAKEDVVQHNIRLNLSNPYDLKLHQAILNANMDIYKSKNNYLRKIAYRGVFGDTEGLEAETDIVDFNDFVSRKELEELEKRVRASVIQEVFGLLFSSVTTRAVVPATVQNVQATSEIEVDDAVADAAMGYF